MRINYVPLSGAWRRGHYMARVRAFRKCVNALSVPEELRPEQETLMKRDVEKEKASPQVS